MVNNVPDSLSRVWSLTKSTLMLQEARKQIELMGCDSYSSIRFRAIYSLISNAVVGLTYSEWKDSGFQELYSELIKWELLY